MRIAWRIAIPVLALPLIASGSAAAIDGATTQPAAPDYPLAICVVSGQPLGSMGDPHVIQHDGREVRFCCDHCEPAFRKNPARHIQKLDAASQRSATMPSTTQPATRPAGGIEDHRG